MTRKREGEGGRGETGELTWVGENLVGFVDGGHLGFGPAGLVRVRLEGRFPAATGGGQVRMEGRGKRKEGGTH